ncbi:hypothetical protein [Frankia sp. AvcI1]|uniref:hypothetical protein n=1 Tax=Frankia sp. AvcI1 TaxID=573496 RepID=UPI002118F1F2|nr:hypothetical protein [Frankia sp. AvcI1]
MSLHEFEVDATTNPARPVVTVDGIEQGPVSRISIDTRPGRTVPTLYLEFARGGRFVGSGDVVVRSNGPDAIRAWLAGLDPAAIERAALAVEEAAGGPVSPGRMFRDGLIALLDAGEARRG